MILRKIVLMAAVCCLPASAEAKGYPVGTYPEKWARLSAADWGQAKAEIDKLLQSTWQDVDQSVSMNAVWVILRIRDIKWSKEEQMTVSTYLRSAVETISGHRSGFVEPARVHIDPKTLEDARIRIPGALIGSLLAVDPNEGCKAIVSVFAECQKTPNSSYCGMLRMSALEEMHKHAGTRAIAECVTQIKQVADVAFTREEQRIVDGILLKHALGMYSDQGAAFKHVVGTWHEHDLRVTLSDETQRWWFLRLVTLKKTYGTLDPNVPLAMAKSEKSLAKRYVYLYAACFAVNCGDSTAVNSSVGLDVWKAVETLYRDKEVMSVAGREGTRDFLRDAWASMKLKISRGAPATMRSTNSTRGEDDANVPVQ